MNNTVKCIFENREVSWLKFNERVLEEAEDKNVPLFERLRFISIYNSNLDEFFMVRVGSLYDQMFYDKKATDNKQLKTAQQLIKEVFNQSEQLSVLADNVYKGLMEEFAKSKFPIEHLNTKSLAKYEYDYLKSIFEKDIAPNISPFLIEEKHPFPLLQNQGTIIGAALARKLKYNVFGYIPISSLLPKLIFLPSDGIKFILIEELIFLFMKQIFHNFTVGDGGIFSILKNADINENEGLYDYDIDFRHTMSKIIERRYRLAPVSLKIIGNPEGYFVNHLKKQLCLDKKQICFRNMPINFSFLSDLEKKIPEHVRPDLLYKKIKNKPCTDINDTEPILDQIRKRDLLLSYPFNDINIFIDFLNQVSEDKRVTDINITLYRMAKDSKVVANLIKAAKNGIAVKCIVELRARFDEENNIDWSKRLEDAGCEVIYGLPNYKVHSKLLLINMINEMGEIESITQIGTGNYNEITSRIYTDLSLFTANKNIATDAKNILESLSKAEFTEHTTDLLVAPLILKPRIIQMIENEINKVKDDKPAGITLKMNSLTDKDIIDKLIEASQAGVKIDLIIRGICCLIAGIEGFSENITVRSIVGRFLEHSRIYIFGTREDSNMYISSADFMTRNTENRVEVATPIYDAEIKNKLWHIIDLELADNIKARIMEPNGNYYYALASKDEKTIDSQMMLFSK